MSNDNPWGAGGAYESENDPYRNSFDDDNQYEDEENDDEYESDQEASFNQNRGRQATNLRSGCKTGCILLLIIFGGTSLLCCGGFGVLVYYFMPTTVVEPAAVDSLKEEMVQVDLPNELNPVTGVHFGVSFLQRTKVVAYSTEENNINLQIIRMDALLAGVIEVTPEIKERANSHNPQLTLQKSKKKLLTVQEEQYPFTLTTGKEKWTDKTVFMISGTILTQNKDNNSILILINLSSTDPKFGEKEAIELIESIKIPE